MYDYIFAE